MSFVNRGDGSDHRARDAAGGPPSLDVDFDPHDPDQVRVHYDLSGWGIEQRAEVAETLAEREIPHRWEGDELVVLELHESLVDAAFEELERELGPFPVVLGADEDGTPFELGDWTPGDVEMLQQSLTEAEIPHRWEGATLVVAPDAELVVDDLVDAVEAGEAASLDEQAEAPDGALATLFSSADRLARDADDAAARSGLIALVPDLAADAPPYGMAMRAWAVIVERARLLVERLTDDSEPGGVSAAAEELRVATRPYV